MKRLLLILLLPAIWCTKLQGAEITFPHIVFFVNSGVERVVEDNGGDFTVEFGTTSNIPAAQFISDVNAALAAKHWSWLTLKEFTFTATSTGRATFTVGAHSEKADFTFRIYDSSHTSHIPVRQLAYTAYRIENPGLHEIFHEQRASIRLNTSAAGETYTLLRNGSPVSTKIGTGAALTFLASEPGTYTIAGSQNRIRGNAVLQLYSFLRSAQIQPQMNPVYLPGESLNSPLTCTFSPANPPMRSQLETMFAAFNNGEVSYWNPNIRIAITQWLADRFVVEIANSVNPGTAGITNDTRILTDTGTFKIMQGSGGGFRSYEVQITASGTDGFGSVTLAGSEWGVDYRLMGNTYNFIRILPGTGTALPFGSYPSGKYTVYASKQGFEKQMPGDSLLLSRPIGTPGRNAVRTVNYTDTCGHYTTDIGYFDGLGYASQQIAVRASGMCDPYSGIPADIVTPIHYDPLRRDNARLYLPYVTEQYNGERHSNPFMSQQRFYKTEYADTCAYAAIDFETSPSGRPLRSWQAGQVFRAANACTSNAYASNAGTDAVRQFRVSASGDLVQDGNYAPAALSKISTTDEDGRIVERYANARSQLVLERRIIGAEDHADTYYVYNDRDSLAWVLPPECTARLQQTTLAPDDPLASRYCYVYTYDGRGNVTEKRLPGCGPQRYIYDQGDRMIAMQDGNMRQTDSWELYAYDAHNRETGRYTATGWTLESLQTQLGSSGVASVSGKTALIEIVYDTYPAAAAPPAGITCDTRTQGLKTFERLRIDDTQEFLARTFYYDFRGRCIQTLEQSPRTTRSVTSEYDFRGNTIRTCEITRVGEAPADTLIVCSSYDDRDRLVAETTSLNGSTPLRNTYHYDKLGRLVARRYAADGNILTDTLRYDIRGWLTEQRNDRFATSLHYYDPQQTATIPSYTGNITEWTFRHTGESSHTYAFAYDALSRLTETKQYIDGTANDRFVEKGLTYDRNGNILTLQRTAGGTMPDNFSYTYTGNRLSALAGTASGTYDYDANGNMTRDGVSGLNISYNRLNLIEKVERNGGILAEYSYLADGTKYAATDDAGNGLVYVGSLVYKKQNGSYALESAAFSGGRFVATETASGTTCLPHCFVTDHLGSVRVVVNAQGEVVERNDYYPFGLRWNDSESQISDNRYRYNAKEEQTFVNVPYIDYGARMYDPKFRLGWNTSDPLAEKYYPISTYTFCGNNPINYIDPNGLEIRGITKQDAQNFRDDIYKILAGEKFANIRALIDIKGKTFKSIDVGALRSAIEGVALTDDESAYITMITSAINSKDIYKVEYISGDFTSAEGAEAFVNHMNHTLEEGIGDKMTTPDGKLSTAWIRNSGNGLNVPTTKGSHSFIGDNLQSAERAVISGHEVLGHGIPAARKLTPAANNANAIRTDNLIRRILGLPQRDGSNHGGYQEGHITNPYILPIIQ